MWANVFTGPARSQTFLLRQASGIGATYRAPRSAAPAAAHEPPRDEWQEKVEEASRETVDYFRQQSTRVVEHFETTFGSEAWCALMRRLHPTGISTSANL